MVARADGAGLKEWRFHEEPPEPVEKARPKEAPLSGPTIGRINVTPGGEVTFTSPATEARSRPSASAAKGPPTLSPVVGADKRFTDPSALTHEVFRLKAEITNGKHEPSTHAALRQQLMMRQSEWVSRAKAASWPEPSRALDPMTATPAEIASAFLWSETGGVIPRGEIERDGGRTFRAGVRDAVTLHAQGFDAMLEDHAGHPDEQKALVVRSLQKLGVAIPAGTSSVEALCDLRRDTLLSRSAAALWREQQEAARQLYIGLDGFVGTAERLDAYEREKAIEAANPGSTLGSIYATYLGGGDVERMRALGNAGNALEGMGGGAGLHVTQVRNARAPVGTQKLGASDFNGNGQAARFKTKPMDKSYFTENINGNERWPTSTKSNNAASKSGASSGPGARDSTRFDTVRYHDTRSARAPFKIDVREVNVGGMQELRLVNAEGGLFDTRGSTNYSGERRAIFVMNASGELYASTFQKKGFVHHSSLAGGAPVAAAGELVVEKGRLVAITTSSGHYRPTPEYTKQLLTSLRERGMNLAGVRLYDASTNTTTVLDH